MNSRQTLGRWLKRVATSRRAGRCFRLVALSYAVSLGFVPAFAQAPVTAPGPHEQREAQDQPATTTPQSSTGTASTPSARDPNAYSDGYKSSGMTGHMRSDQIPVGLVLVDELELLSGNEGRGSNWSFKRTYGGDIDKLWLRSQGLVIGESTDPTTGVEALWWHGYSAFWGSLLGVRQDFGPGAHTWLAFGLEGLSPYWLRLQATGYLGDDGRLSARLKAAYDLLFTNRAILTPGLESNLYSQSEPNRTLGAGVGNLEVGLRLRYEFSRKFAPYIGYVWERSFGQTATLRRADGEPITEQRFVAGVRVWR